MPAAETTLTTEASGTAAPARVENAVLNRLLETVDLVRKGVENNDDSYFLRALRRTTFLRKQTQPGELKPFLIRCLKSVPAVAQSVGELLASAQGSSLMELDDGSSNAPLAGEETLRTIEESENILPEIELYLHHTALHAAKTHKTCSASVLQKSARLMMDRAKLNERRTMDVLRARAWHTFSLVFESESGVLDSGVREEMLAAHRAACLRLDEAGQAVTINIILRDLVSQNLVSEAARFASKARFPDRAGNNYQVRHLYYLGRVEALQLEYGEALNLIQQAIRKTPTTCGRGFRLKLHELATVITLLTGEIPERAWFSDQELGDALAPYFDLVKAVRVGNVASFELCLQLHSARFAKDKTLTLVQRLRSSVIKTGLKAIGQAYSKISFADVAQKLKLDQADSDPEEALYLCAKAIRDGVLDATIDSTNGWLLSSEQPDIYSSTSDPQKAYQRRINFLLQIHNDAVKGLRYPPDAHKTTSKVTPVVVEGEEINLDDLGDDLDED